MRIITALIVALTLFTVGCANKDATSTTKTAKTASAAPADPFAEGSTLYTLTNLHPDPRHRLFTTNLLQPGLLPRCSAMTITDKGKKRIKFSSNGAEYSFEPNGRAAPEALDEGLKKYFGRTCDKNAVAKMSAVDQKGVREGKAYAGMTRQGVTYALGYPLLSDDSLWTYHKMIFGDKVTVEFNASGIVTKVKD